MVKEYGGKVNVSAYEGKAFIALSWVATILMLIAMGCWIPGARAFWRYQMKDAKRKTGQAMKNPMQGNDFFSQSSSPMRGPMQGGPTPDWPMQDGPMPDGPMRGGPMPDGPMRGGPMRGGPMRGGPMQGEDGEVGEDGPMRGGPMRGGRMRGEDGEDGEDRVDMVDMRR